MFFLGAKSLFSFTEIGTFTGASFELIAGNCSPVKFKYIASAMPIPLPIFETSSENSISA